MTVRSGPSPEPHPLRPPPMMIVFESEEKTCAREQDPRRQEGQKSAQAGWAEIIDGQVKFNDLTVMQDVAA